MVEFTSALEFKISSQRYIWFLFACMRCIDMLCRDDCKAIVSNVDDIKITANHTLFAVSVSFIWFFLYYLTKYYIKLYAESTTVEIFLYYLTGAYADFDPRSTTVEIFLYYLTVVVVVRLFTSTTVEIFLYYLTRLKPRTNNYDLQQ